VLSIQDGKRAPSPVAEAMAIATCMGLTVVACIWDGGRDRKTERKRRKGKRGEIYMMCPMGYGPLDPLVTTIFSKVSTTWSYRRMLALVE